MTCSSRIRREAGDPAYRTYSLTIVRGIPARLPLTILDSPSNTMNGTLNAPPLPPSFTTSIFVLDRGVFIFRQLARRSASVRSPYPARRPALPHHCGSRGPAAPDNHRGVARIGRGDEKNNVSKKNKKIISVYCVYTVCIELYASSSATYGVFTINIKYYILRVMSILQYIIYILYRYHRVQTVSFGVCVT